MSSSLYGATAIMVLIAGIGVVWTAGANSKPAVATITTIDRTCDFIETRSTPDGHKSARDLTDSCNSTDEWDRVRDAIREHRRNKISGHEVVHVSYVAPQNGSERTADLQFDGSDDEFYELEAGDHVDILVSDKDPTKIRKA